MDPIQTIILGIIEGFTEFLPISSTFHLIWASKLLGIGQTDFTKLFEVVIQSGAILAVVVLYVKTVLKDFGFIKKIIVSFVPTALVGFILFKAIKDVFFTNYLLQLAVFLIVGIIFIVFEKLREKQTLTKTVAQITYGQAALIGLCQSLAVFPGISRAGAVIIGMMILNVKRDEAAKYSFILALPTIASASLLDLYKSRATLIGHSQQLLTLALGFTVAFISALLVVKWFISYLQKNTISAFGWYRIALAIILAITYIKS